MLEKKQFFEAPRIAPFCDDADRVRPQIFHAHARRSPVTNLLISIKKITFHHHRPFITTAHSFLAKLKNAYTQRRSFSR